MDSGLGVVKVNDLVVASGKRFGRRFEEGEATIPLDSGRIEQNRRCYSGGAPHARSRFRLASTRFNPTLSHQRALQSIKTVANSEPTRESSPLTWGGRRAPDSVVASVSAKRLRIVC